MREGDDCPEGDGHSQTLEYHFCPQMKTFQTMRMRRSLLQRHLDHSHDDGADALRVAPPLHRQLVQVVAVEDLETRLEVFEAVVALPVLRTKHIHD
jgi:urate oxidase